MDTSSSSRERSRALPSVGIDDDGHSGTLRKMLDERRAQATQRAGVVVGAGLAYGEAESVADLAQIRSRKDEIERHQRLRRDTLAGWTDSKAIKERLEKVAADEGETFSISNCYEPQQLDDRPM